MPAPGRPPCRALGGDRTINPAIQPHAALVGRGSLLSGGDGGSSLARLAGRGRNDATAVGVRETASGRGETASGSQDLPQGHGSRTAPIAEDRVVAATFQQPVEPPPDLVLGDKPPASALAELHAGQRVRAGPGHRATLAATGAGLIVNKEGVRFENIDFVWSPASAKEGVRREGSAIVRLLTGRAEFRGCSFRCGGDCPDSV